RPRGGTRHHRRGAHRARKHGPRGALHQQEGTDPMTSVTSFTPRRTLRIGFIGSGFIAHFHLKSLLGVRNVEVTAVYSPTPAKRQKLADAVAVMELGT